MKSLISAVVLMFVTIQCIGQADAGDKKNVIKFTPLKLFTLQNSSIEFSYERVTGDVFSSQIMVSWLLPERIMMENIGFNRNLKGYRIAI